jgi:hypothetical protein
VRYLAWLLLLANLGMLVWLITQPEPQPVRYRPIPVPPGIEPLVLLSERPANTAVAVQEQNRPQVPRSPQETVPPAVSDVAAVDATKAEEAGEPEADKVQGAGTDAAAQPAAAVEPVCQAIGPFLKEADASAVGEQLSKQGYQPHLRTGEVRNPAGYWVYMPAMPAAEARRIVAELDAHGMTDYFIGNQNYISLGIFSGKTKARVRLKQIQALGFDAILDQRYRTSTVYWIDIEQGPLSLLGSDLWSEIQSQHMDIRVQRISCE